MPKINLVFLCILIAFLCALLSCEPRIASRPPKDNPSDPTLAGVGNKAITFNFFRYALGNLPVDRRAPFLNEEGRKEFLESLIDRMAYYHEGLRRNYDKEPDYQVRLDLAQKLTLIRMAELELEKSFTATGSDEERLQAFGSAFSARIEKLKSDFGLKTNENALNGFPAKVDPNAMLVESRAFNLTAEEFKAWMASLPENRKELSGTPDGVRTLLKTYIDNELMYYDALVQKLNESAEYKNRMFVMEVFILGQFTIEKITGTNITATKKEGRIYFENHPELFTGKTWEESRPVAMQSASREKIARVTKELAFALRRDRYPVRYNQGNIKKFDVSSLSRPDPTTSPFLIPLIEITAENGRKAPATAPAAAAEPEENEE